MTSTVVDNDVLIKLAAYRLLESGVAVLGGAAEVGVLGAARYVIPTVIARDGRIADSDGAIACWSEMADSLEPLEPSEGELKLAVAVEEFAARRGLPLDIGESQLIAITVLRPVALFATGDKRAIAAAETLRSELAELTALDGLVACFEQIIHRLIDVLDRATVRNAVCAEPKADRAIGICMGCASGQNTTESIAEGLASYISDLRKRAPSLLGEL